ncbi:hypothetical protein DFP75_10195 [Marinomonas alcarazii]|uniref:DUF4145 domain-containing protein n=1 Tax=Marinomonas alcarazii TaxID=491949 RepID=A0A318V7L4_9GAMM|nr:hypothetical protein [Marinomonas alcarazii]PYF84073.1 hypothetical protein DFP75_10195 [Marinomonas alcarazii]
MESIDFCTFVENSSLYEEAEINIDLINNHGYVSLNAEMIPNFYCSSCARNQKFDLMNNNESENYWKKTLSNIFRVVYRCRNCKNSYKTLSLRVVSPSDRYNLGTGTHSVKVQKVGEFPERVIPIPKRIERLMGGDRKLFYKGLKCENLGMGIAAFAYYRRVIDSKKNVIFDEIIKVLKIDGSDELLIEELTAAKSETQFTKSIGRIKKALPNSLKIQGQDPLKLLYAALSEGLHSKQDEECLQNAKDIKIIIFYLIEKIELALNDDDALKEAVKRLRK